MEKPHVSIVRVMRAYCLEADDIIAVGCRPDPRHLDNVVLPKSTSKLHVQK